MDVETKESQSPLEFIQRAGNSLRIYLESQGIKCHDSAADQSPWKALFRADLNIGRTNIHVIRQYMPLPMAQKHSRHLDRTLIVDAELRTYDARDLLHLLDDCDPIQAIYPWQTAFYDLGHLHSYVNHLNEFIPKLPARNRHKELG